jgi:glycosyltransferase involved in cell wall biosynthesis
VKLFKLFIKHWAVRREYDVMVVGFPGQAMTFFAKLITRKPVVLDAFYSLYNTVVEDRRLKKPGTPGAWYYFFLDWASVRVADQVLIDTAAHARYFHAIFNVSQEKIFIVRVGADDEIFYPRPKKKSLEKKFEVLFHGTYIPLHGVQYIIRAAKVLEEDSTIQINLLGNGQLLQESLRLAERLEVRNIIFRTERIPAEELVMVIASADVCLGIFGATKKASVVIPNKIYESLAMEKPVITADTPAVREIFTEQDLIFVPPANSEALANAIRRLKGDVVFKERLAHSGRRAYLNNASFVVIGSILRNCLTNLK